MPEPFRVGDPKVRKGLIFTKRFYFCEKDFYTGGGGGGTLKFHTYVGSGYFLGVQNFEFQYIWGFSEK